MDPTQFDDPALKAALKNRLVVERAPDHLRQRITTLLAETPVLSDATPAPKGIVPTLGAGRPQRFFRFTPFRVAAGLLLFGFVLTTYFLLRPTPAALMENGLLLAMIETHDYCCSHTFHQHPELDDRDFSKMQAQAAAHLKHPVVAAPVEGWQFKGIYLCPIGGDGPRSAHLLFHRGEQRLSIFTVADPNPTGQLKRALTRINDRLIAAMSKNGTALGIVAHPAEGSLSLADLETLLQKHADRLTPPAVALLSAAVAPAELLD